VLVAPLAAQLLHSVAFLKLPINRAYTGIVNSNQHLAVCEASFKCADATVLVDSYCSHACPESSIGFQVMVHFPLHSFLISLLLEPLSVDHQRCRVRMNQALWANATIIAASLFGQTVNGWTCSSPIPHFRVPTGYRIDHREPRRTSTENYRQYERVCSSFTADPGLGIRCSKEVFAIWETTIFQVRRGSWQPACSPEK
jgi:hypothetical protein